MMLTQLFIVAVLCYQKVLCDKKQVCVYKDTNYCIPEEAKKVYNRLMNGDIKNVPVSDLLYADLIEADLPTVKYTLRNATLAELKTCTPDLFEININDLRYHYHLACKHVVIESIYEIKGKLGTIYVEGHGDAKIDFYDYVFLFNGVLEQTFHEDQKFHIKIKHYNLDMEAKGKVVYDFKNLFDGNMEKSNAVHKYINENWKEVDKLIRQPIMEKFMSILIKNANVYFDIVPIEHAFKKA